MLQLCKIEAIQPNPEGSADDSCDEGWFHRTIVRTFKLSGATYEDITRQADELLAAWLLVHPGSAGTWTLTQWYPGR